MARALLLLLVLGKALAPLHATASLAFHRREHERLLAEQAALTKQIIETQVQLQLLEAQIESERQTYEDVHLKTAVQSALPSPRGGVSRPLTCQGWKQTSRCLHDGGRRPALDKPCSTVMNGGAAGYCEVKDESTGEFFKVMRANCPSVSLTASFSCDLAPQFANFPAEIERLVAEEVAVASSEVPMVEVESKGILLVVLSFQISQAVRLVRTLRSLGCALPIEIWFFQEEMATRAQKSQWPVAVDALVAVSDASTKLRPFISLEYSPHAVHHAKIHAIIHSDFSNVLFLDVAVAPLRDPTYLFTQTEFQTRGALFWPDLFHPDTTESHIEPSSLLWELLDMPFLRMFEQDDRQLLINRDFPGVRAALRVAKFVVTHQPNLFTRLNLVGRQKDFTRLAWLKTSIPFHMTRIPPGLGGSLLPGGSFCGTHIVQHDSNGEAVFLHQLEPSGASPITHVQVVDWEENDAKDRLTQQNILSQFNVRSFQPIESKTTTCYAHVWRPDEQKRFATKEWVL